MTSSVSSGAANGRTGGRRASPRRFHVEHVLIPLAALVIWQYASGRWIDEIYISSPLAIVRELGDEFAGGSIWPSVQVTFSEIGVGFVFGFVPGVVVGNLMGLSKRIGRLLSPYLTFFFTIPLIAIAPIFVIWLGIEFQMKVGLVAFMVFFLVARTTFTGMSDLSEEVLESVGIMGANRWQRVWMAILPQELIWVLAGAKIAVPLAVAGGITGEFISSNRGLGFDMLNAASVLDTTRLLTAVFILAVVVTGIVGVLALVERRLLGWRLRPS